MDYCSCHFFKWLVYQLLFLPFTKNEGISYIPDYQVFFAGGEEAVETTRKSLKNLYLFSSFFRAVPEGHSGQREDTVPAEGAAAETESQTNPLQ